MKNLRVLFMGTPDFAVNSLKMLVENTSVIGVVTQPDKPKGRGHKVSASPVKIFAESQNISVYQPAKVKDESFIAELCKLNPDIIIVVAFGQIFFYDIPKYRADNNRTLHGWRKINPYPYRKRGKSQSFFTAL